MAFELSYAGVVLPNVTQDVWDRVDAYIATKDLRDILPVQPWTSPRLYGAAIPTPPEMPEVRLGQFFYPAGASRWGVFYGIAGSTQVTAMQNAAFPAGIPTANNFVIQADAGTDTSSSGGRSTAMYMLPARWLFSNSNALLDDLYLVTFVDERYYFQFNPSSKLQISSASTWDGIIAQLASNLGITLAFAPTLADYGQPAEDSQLYSNFENPASLLDAVAWNTGRLVVRYYNGNYALQTPLDALKAATANRGTITLAGGAPLAAASGGYVQSGPAIVPANINVTFPKWVTGSGYVDNRNTGDVSRQSYGDVYQISVTLAQAVTTASYGAAFLTSGTGTKVIHDTARAYYATTDTSGVPTNGSLLATLAQRLAADYVMAQLMGVDEVYQGIRQWNSEGADDVLYTLRSTIASTRAQRRAWNAGVTEMQHETSYALATSGPVVKIQLLRVTSTTTVSGCYPANVQTETSGSPPTAADVASTAQIETLMVLGAITASGAGNATVIVAAAGMTGSPRTVSVAVANSDTAAIVAGKVQAALTADGDVGGFFTVTNPAGADVVLTAITAAANDPTYQITIANGTCAGLTAATSTHTTAGSSPKALYWSANGTPPLSGGSGTGPFYQGRLLPFQLSGLPIYESIEAPVFATFAVTSESDDYVTCKLLTAGMDNNAYSSSAGSGGTVKVAKPYRLRKTTWNGQSETINGDVWTYSDFTTPGQRTAVATINDNTVAKTEYITKPYVTGEEIHVIQGGDGVNGCDWADLNYGPKSWQTPGYLVVQKTDATPTTTTLISRMTVNFIAPIIPNDNITNKSTDISLDTNGTYNFAGNVTFNGATVDWNNTNERYNGGLRTFNGTNSTLSTNASLTAGNGSTVNLGTGSTVNLRTGLIVANGTTVLKPFNGAAACQPISLSNAPIVLGASFGCIPFSVTLSADINDMATCKSVIHVITDSSNIWHITGMVAPLAESTYNQATFVYFYNDPTTGGYFIISHQSGFSSAGNKFNNVTGSDIIVNPGETIVYFYDSTNSCYQQIDKNVFRTGSAHHSYGHVPDPGSSSPKSPSQVLTDKTSSWFQWLATKGDIATTDGTNLTAQAAGANNSILTADNAQPNGLHYRSLINIVEDASIVADINPDVIQLFGHDDTGALAWYNVNQC